MNEKTIRWLSLIERSPQWLLIWEVVVGGLIIKMTSIHCVYFGKVFYHVWDAALIRINCAYFSWKASLGVTTCYVQPRVSNLTASLMAKK